MNYNKYENYIRVGHTGTETGVDKYGQITYSCSDLQDFPTPSALGTTLSDVDKDPFTDLQGYTHRNRVRHDVLADVSVEYNILSDDDIAFILNAIDYEWFYVELIDKKTKQKKVHKMYPSDKTFDTWKVWKDDQGNWHEEKIAFSVSFVEE